MVKTTARNAPGQRSGGRRLAFSFLHILFPFVLGSAIYILWRSKSIVLFSWLGYVGLQAPIVGMRTHCAGAKHLIPNLILYSAPDGLWLYSFTALMGVIWFNEPSKTLRAFWILFPLLGIASEFAQRFKLIPGTFDWSDVFCYAVAWTFAVISVHKFLGRGATYLARYPSGAKARSRSFAAIE